MPKVTARAATLISLALVSCTAPTPPAPSPAVSPATTAGTPATPSAACGDPHAHVYSPDRLRLLAPCVTVLGVIDSIRREPDGDDHIRLRVDPGQRDPRGGGFVNQRNVEAQGGDLVLEPVCVHTVIQPDAVEACRGYRNPIVIPPVGSHVAATGAWVLDLDHGSWAELHPLFAIEVR